eukprot:11427818-Alexandrium_andersonii.AAC.1
MAPVGAPVGPGEFRKVPESAGLLASSEEPPGGGLRGSPQSFWKTFSHVVYHAWNANGEAGKQRCRVLAAESSCGHV